MEFWLSKSYESINPPPRCPSAPRLTVLLSMSRYYSELNLVLWAALLMLVILVLGH